MGRNLGRHGPLRGTWAVAAWAVLAWGCAASRPPAPAPAPAPAGPLPRVALLPLENLSGRPECGDLLTRICQGALARTGTCEPAEPGDIEGAMAEARVRTTGLLTSEQAVQIAGRLRARYLLAGTILECGRVRTPEGEVPSVGVALRLLTGDSAQVVWTAMKVRTGDDRETIFGWGRELSLERLAERTMGEMFESFRIPAGSRGSAAAGAIR